MIKEVKDYDMMERSMLMLRIAIVDDDEMFLSYFSELVRKQLEKQQVEYSIANYTSSIAFNDDCISQKFNLIFLDIDMPHISGMQIASNLRKMNIATTLLFVSGHNSFVYESIHYMPFRFIRKWELDSDLSEALTTYFFQTQFRNKTIALQVQGHQTRIFDIMHIMYFYSLRHEINVVTNSRESIRLALRSYTMERLEQQMREYKFIRTHKTYLVNYHCIYKIQAEGIILKDQSVVSVSRSRLAAVKEQYQIFLREEDML